jgi:hypothetical protein
VDIDIIEGNEARISLAVEAGVQAERRHSAGHDDQYLLKVISQ